MVQTFATRLVKIAVLTFTLGAASCSPDRDDGVVEDTRQASKLDSKSRDATDEIYRWNRIMLDANAIDHTPVEPGEARTYGEQLGRPRTARAFAIVQIAVFDAFN